MAPYSAAPSVTVTVFVRHKDNCKHAANEFSQKCKCGKHLRWTFQGKQYRRSAKTRVWSAACEAADEVKKKFNDVSPAIELTAPSQTRKTLVGAVELFMLGKNNQGLSASVIKKYIRELGRLVEFAEGKGVYFPSEIDLELLEEYRATWLKQYPSTNTRAKVQERLRTFLRFCAEADFLRRVPRLSPISLDEVPTVPFEDEEFEHILATIPKRFKGDKAIRMRGLVLLMRWSGLAVTDACSLKWTQFKNEDGEDRVVTARTKTGTHVSVPIEKPIAADIRAAGLLNKNPRYLFWNTGTGEVESMSSDWQKELRKLFIAAELPEGHPHRFRDTFSIRYLENDIPLEELSQLLGHRSVKTTEKAYLPWVKSRQKRLDTLIRAKWPTESGTR